jgi:hypothetical protein
MMKRYVFGLSLSTIFGVFLVGIWVRFCMDPGRTFAYLGQANLFFAAAAVVCYVVAYLFRSLRWQYILLPIQGLSLRHAFSIYLGATFINIIFPVRMGEFAKCFLVKRLKGISFSKALPTIFVDRFMDLLLIVIIYIASYPVLLRLPHKMQPILYMGFVLFGLILVFFLLCVVWGKAFLELIKALCSPVPERLRHRLVRSAGLFLEGMEAVKGSPRRIIPIFLLTLLAVLAEVLVLYLLFWAFSLKVTLPCVILGYSLVTLSFMIPTAPGYIGTFEGAWFLVFHMLLGVEKDLSNAVCIFSHLILSFVAVVLGGLMLGYIGIKSVRVIREEFESLEEFPESDCRA